MSKLEIREEPDQIALATRAVEDMRSASEQFRTNIEGELRRRDERIAALETRLNRPGQPNGNADQSREVYRRAFDGYLRRGEHRLTRDEVEALERRTVLTTGTSDGGGGPNAGYLVPPEFLAELDKNLVLFSPMRSIARVLQASTPAVILPKRTAIPTVSWETEETAEPAVNPVYANQTLSIFEMKGYVDVSNRMLEDSAFSIDALMAEDLGEAFGKLEGATFVNGVSGGPQGLLGSGAAAITTTTTAANTGPTADEVITFFHSLPTPYAQQATWVMNRSTIGYLRQLTLGSGSFFAWPTPFTGLVDGNAQTLLGRPIVEFPDMPSIGSATTPIAFGDFRSGFKIFDRVSLAILRDPYSQQSAGNVRFHARRRVGGEVTKAEALRLMTIHA
jgi:HK97 family phage major capsid protein